MLHRLRTRYKPVPEDACLKKLGTATQASFGATIKTISWNMFKARRAGCMPDLTTLAAGAELVLLQEAVLHGGLAHPFHLASGLEWIMAENFGTEHHAVTTGPKSGSRVAALTSTAIRSLDREPLIDT